MEIEVNVDKFIGKKGGLHAESTGYGVVCRPNGGFDIEGEAQIGSVL